MSSLGIIYYQCGIYLINLKPGKYQIEAWGAQGGGFTEYSCEGGKGAYAKGILTLDEPTKIFVSIGESTNITTRNNTCNGGGLSKFSANTYFTTRSGGGSTDVRIGDTNLKHRVIVAAGGGGSAIGRGKCGKGGDAGSISGFDGQCSGNSECFDFGGGATQTSGGSGNKYGQKGTFFYGGSNTYSEWSGSGGGSGWFGGGAGCSYGSGGGGGSSYVYEGINSEYQLLEKKYSLENAILIAGNEEMPNPSNLETTEIGHSGNGAVLITFLYEKNCNFGKPIFSKVIIFMVLHVIS